MIDKKKIERTANFVFEGIDNNPSIEKDAFILGAQWAQEEFVKSLWHDASEEPKSQDGYNSIYVLDKHRNIQNVLYLTKYEDWEGYMESYEAVAWCYKSDLLPKKEGGE